MSKAAKERPILFSGPMVRAILAGAKTQTRRVMKVQPIGGHGGPHARLVMADDAPEKWRDCYDVRVFCPYGQPGDRLWVRETWRSPEKNLAAWGRVAYQADGVAGAWMGDGGGGRIFVHHGYLVGFNHTEKAGYWCGPSKYGDRWRPSIHMPRWASRLMLEVMDVRVERLQDIKEHDAIAEGIGSPMLRDCKVVPKFRELWDDLNAARGFGWDANPWVWVISFRRCDPVLSTPTTPRDEA